MPEKLRTIALLRILLVASLVGPAILMAAVGWLTYQATFAEAEREIVRTSEVAREHAAKVFDSFELVSDRVLEVIDGFDSLSIQSNEERLHDKFATIIHDLPQIQSLIVVSADGRPLVATGAYPVRSSENFSDRDYFGALKTGDARTYISQVQTSRITGKSFFGWGRARRNAANGFDGVVDIAASPDFFMQFYATLIRETGNNVGGRVVTMVRSDGQILVRYPYIEGGQVQAPPGNLFFAAIRNSPEAGVYVNRSVVESNAPERLFAFRRVPGHPIYIVAGRSISAITSEWLRAMFGYSTVGIPATAALFFVTLVTLRGARREQEALTQLHQEMAKREIAEDQLRHSQKMDAIGQLTGGIAHDFNNLLTIISSSVELLQRPNVAEERQRRYLSAIAETCSRASKLTAQLLAFARRQALQPELFDVGDNIRAVLEMIGTLVGSRITILSNLPATPLCVNADPTQFDTSIVNMALNARDAMNGQGRISVSVRAVDEITGQRSRAALAGRYVAVSIADTGAGIPPDRLDQVFEPFFTTKKVGQGTGLGLSQVFGFAKQSGGEVLVESQLGHGANFTLYLPRVEGAVRPAAQTGEFSSLPVGSRVRVLVVEDDLGVGVAATHALAELGFDSLLTASADEALRELAKDSSRFDVVFSDVVLPGKSGLDLGLEIRRRRPGVPVVLTSGYSDALAQNGTEGFALLVKPYSIDELSRILREAMRRGHAVSQA